MHFDRLTRRLENEDLQKDDLANDDLVLVILFHNF